MIEKKIGAPIAWMISAFVSDVVAIPIPMVAAHNAQPMNAWIKITRYFLLVINYPSTLKTKYLITSAVAVAAGFLLKLDGRVLDVKFLIQQLF